MSMSKKDFIALADVIRELVAVDGDPNGLVSIRAITEHLADFCQQQNGNFKRERWLGYIAGQCGPNGGSL